MIGIVLSLVLAASCPNPARSKSVVAEFKSTHPCPEYCAVFIKDNGTYKLWKKCGRCNVDHICPLACCGKDTVDNMQWLTVEANLKKGARDCAKHCK
mgnify:FL=1